MAAYAFYKINMFEKIEECINMNVDPEKIKEAYVRVNRSKTVIDCIWRREMLYEDFDRNGFLQG